MSESERKQHGNKPPVTTPLRPPIPSDPLPDAGPKPPSTPKKPPKK